MTRPQAVIFDIGNVLIEWNPERYYDSQLGEEARRRLFDEVPLTQMNLDIDAGALFRETIYDMADRHPHWAEPIRWWHDRWIHMASPRIEPSIALLRALRKRGVPVFALTNFGIHSFAYAETQYDFFTEFDRRYISGELGVIKAGPARSMPPSKRIADCRPRRFCSPTTSPRMSRRPWRAAGRRTCSTARKAGRGGWWRRGF